MKKFEIKELGITISAKNDEVFIQFGKELKSTLHYRNFGITNGTLVLQALNEVIKVVLKTLEAPHDGLRLFQDAKGDLKLIYSKEFRRWSNKKLIN